jgi:hypothetical protein
MILNFFQKIDPPTSASQLDAGAVWYACFHADRSGRRRPLKVTKSMRNNYKRKHLPLQILMII